MPAPTSATYSTAALVAAQTALRDLIDAGSGAGYIRILTAADAVLAQIPLADPCGTVSGTTGVLTLSAPGSANASASGQAAYAQVCASTGTVHLALPVQAGSAPVAGVLALNTVTLVAGGPVTIISATIG